MRSFIALEFSDRIVKGLLRQIASTVGAVENFVVDDGEIQGKTEADGVCRWELGDSHVR